MTGRVLQRYWMSSVVMSAASVLRRSAQRYSRHLFTLLRWVLRVLSLRFTDLRWSIHSSVSAIGKRVSGCFMT